MPLREFALERFFAKHEFSSKHILGASDVEGMSMSEVLALADPETRSLWDNLRLGYTESQGLPALRHEIASLYRGLTSDDVLTFAGAEEAIFLLAHARLSPGDHASVVWPAYQSLHEVARSIGVDVSNVSLDPRTWKFDAEKFIASFTPKTRLAIINFPHNPTGAHISRAELDEVVAACDAKGITLFSDEVYRFLEIDPRETLPPAASLSANAVSLGVMSKSFALAGLRIGWIVTRDSALRERIVRLKDYTTICSSAPSEILALMALRSRDRVIARSRAIVERNLPVLRDFMARNAESLSWVPPRAGGICFPRFAGEVDAERAAEMLIARTGVVILPGGRFGYDRAHFRVGFGRLDMPEALAAIEPHLREAASVDSSTASAHLLRDPG
jgi:aspartate/methionine/tyrosine aminotransferase